MECFWDVSGRTYMRLYRSIIIICILKNVYINNYIINVEASRGAMVQACDCKYAVVGSIVTRGNQNI